MKQQLKLYKVEQLLMLHWTMQKPHAGSLRFLLNDQVLPKPYLAVQMATPLEMFIIADASTHMLSARKNSLCIQLTENKQILAKLEQDSITLLPKKLIRSYTKVVQGRFYTRLLQHTHRRFDDVDDKLIRALIKRYAYPVPEVFQISAELFFFRIPWDIEFDKNLLSFNVAYVTEQGEIEEQKQLALWLDGALHLFVKTGALAEWYGMISHGKTINIPLYFTVAEKISRESLLEKLSKKSNAKKALTSFLLPSFKNKLAGVKNSSHKSSAFKSHVLGLRRQCIIGWAQNEARLSKHVQIDIYENNKKITSITADQDCQQLGYKKTIGDSGFVLPLEDEWLQGEQRQLDLVYSETGELLSGGSIKLGEGCFDCQLIIEQGVLVKGFFQQRTLRDSPYTVQLFLDDKLFCTMDKQGGQAFELGEKLPNIVFDGQLHSVQLKIVNAADGLLLSKKRKIQHQYRGRLQQVDLKRVTGWFFNQSYPDLPVVIDVVINEQNSITAVCDQPRIDIQKKLNLPTKRIGFEVDVPEQFILEPCVKIALYFHGSRVLIYPQQTILTPKDTIIQSLISAAEYLKSSEINADCKQRPGVEANVWVCRQIIEPAINALRQKPGIPQQLQLKLSSKVSQPKIEKSAIIDVIVPVFKGYEETVQCILSVIKAKNLTEFQLIVLNDCSPDGRLKYKLQAMVKQHQFELIENSKNLGFVGTVNKGMRIHPDRDVILLNSDTQVADFWLDRLLASSQKNQNIATVTPFSNNATICSFPQFNQDNKLPLGIDLEGINALFYQYNQGEVVDLPTAIGFCMFIKREALLDVGYFDEKKWHKGYCEENDFCLRAANLGWRHVLSSDVFVEHHGSVSFAGMKQMRITENLALLDRMYPDYAVTVQRFIQRDPVAIQRNRVLKALLKKHSDQYMLFVMHGLGGGSKAHGDHLAQLLEEQQHSVLELSVLAEDKWQLLSLHFGYTLIYHYPRDYAQLLIDLSELGISRIHYHQVLGFPNVIWQLGEELSCSYDYTAHDFMPLCPRINLIDETGHYCGESQFDIKKCQRCIDINGVENSVVEQNLEVFEGSVEKWRVYYADVLAKAQHIFCPSKSTAMLYQQHLALPSIVVKPHPEEHFVISPQTETIGDNILSVAVIGAIGDHKGYQLLLDCAKNALKEGLALRFVIVGYTRDDEPLTRLSNVAITGAYHNAKQLAAYLQQHQCRVAAFLSVWPETFSYTLTEALQHNLYPVTLNYGAVAERLQALQYGQVIAEDLSPREINQALLDAGQKLQQCTKSIQYPGMVYDDLIADYYQLGSE